MNINKSIKHLMYHIGIIPTKTFLWTNITYSSNLTKEVFPDNPLHSNLIVNQSINSNTWNSEDGWHTSL